MASPRWRAASMAMERFSLSLAWPVKSCRRRGRRLASNCASSGLGGGRNQLPVGHGKPSLSNVLEGAAEERFEVFGARRRHGLCGQRLRPWAVRSPGSEARRAHRDRCRKGRALPVERRRRAGGSDQLIFEFEHHALRGLLADAGDAHEALDFAVADGADQIRGGEAGKDGDGQASGRCR